MREINAFFAKIQYRTRVQYLAVKDIFVRETRPTSTTTPCLLLDTITFMPRLFTSSTVDLTKSN